jgi:hypothetical protein
MSLQSFTKDGPLKGHIVSVCDGRCFHVGSSGDIVYLQLIESKCEGSNCCSLALGCGWGSNTMSGV